MEMGVIYHDCAERQPENIKSKQRRLNQKNLESCASLQRKEFPVPWLEALFLPEFPSRSSITEHNFLVSNEIGYGSFGRVYRAVAKNNARGVYALKVQQKSLILGKDAVQQVRREVAVQTPFEWFESWRRNPLAETTYDMALKTIGRA
ncbi:hypothetical protein ANCCEY_03926 [Ancylostoma ceylanicum]|uniref:Protein kinase domain-containing protein n=1 Tax=Ancylostoma ceylanicum TaxID=53326 RepID=A0A0D6M0G3_9BILA|nr:hypothetical protein ANCCEY_03926 [Ancylostoma ceylanicum]